MRNSISEIKKLRGMTMLGVMVGMLMLAVIGFVAFKEASSFLLERKTEKVYSAYHGLDEALDKYVKGNWRLLLANGTTTGIANVWTPTQAELRSMGYLDPFVQTNLQDAGQLTYILTLTPAGCDLGGAQCNIAYVIKPVQGVASEDVAVKTLRRLGASGMINDANNVNLARAWDGRRTMTSPVPVKNALFVTRVYPSSLLAAALPVDGSRPLTGDWNVGTKMMTGVTNLSTDKLQFTEEVVEGSPCNSPAGYTSLAMGSNHYLQICQAGVWVHANEEVTIVTNRVNHTIPSGSGSGSGSSGSSGRPGYLGSDGRLYSDENQTQWCSDCNRPDGKTYQYVAINGNGDVSSSSGTPSIGDSMGSSGTWTGSSTGSGVSSSTGSTPTSSG